MFDTPSITPEHEERFWSKVSKSDDGCWKWLGNTANQCGTFLITRTKKTTPQKMAYFVHNRRWPKRRIVKVCEDSACVNPNHIYESGDIDSPQFKAHFWNGVSILGEDECWPWKRSRNTQGYGQTGSFKNTIVASRVAFYFTHGHWPEFGCHTCDNPVCCNPKHILNGTPKFNVQDMINKGRHNPPRGERCGTSKLKEKEILEIRTLHEEGETNASIARMFGVSGSSISYIVNRKKWRHV